MGFGSLEKGIHQFDPLCVFGDAVMQHFRTNPKATPAILGFLRVVHEALQHAGDGLLSKVLQDRGLGQKPTPWQCDQSNLLASRYRYMFPVNSTFQRATPSKLQHHCVERLPKYTTVLIQACFACWEPSNGYSAHLISNLCQTWN